MALNPEVPGSGNPGSEQQKDEKEQEYRKRHQYREGQTQLEVISTSVERPQLIDAGRTFMNGFEDMSLHPDGSVSEYRLEDAIAVVGNRKADMSYSCKDLTDLGYVIKVKDPKTGAEEDRLVFPGFGYTSKIETVEHSKKILTAQGVLHHIEVEEEPIQVFVSGTDIQREALRKDLGQVQSEMTAREDLVKKLRFLWGQTENLEGLVQFYYMGSLTPEAMNDLCNAEGRTVPNELNKNERVSVLTQTEGGAEYRKGCELGDAQGVALQCMEIAALSEKPAELEALLKTPGIKLLFKVEDQDIDDLFLTPEQRKNPDGSERKIKAVLKNWIGEPWAWKENVEKRAGHSFTRSSKDDLEKPVFGIDPKGEEKINEDGVRGRLTAMGNILCECEWPNTEYVLKQIERFLGGGERGKSNLAQKDARDARFIAWGLLRTTAMATDLGGQAYHLDEDKYLGRPAGDYVHHDMGMMTSCDRVKVIAPDIFRRIYRFVKSEVRGYGPEGSLGKYPDRFTVPYFKNWVGKTEYGTRTFQEMRWGYRAGPEKDLSTGNITNLPEEKAYRLGELPWSKLSPKAYNVAALGPYIAGREKVGIFLHIMRTDYHIEELKDDSFFKKLAQYTGICFNNQTVLNGKFRGVFNGDRTHDTTEAKKFMKDKVRNYKKQFFTAFWDGIRSLPQYREWVASGSDKLDKGGNRIISPIDRIKYRIGTLGILTREEAMKLPTDFIGDDVS